ncbi:unnamed protein product [Discosporangium mesarthrocarpum]
MRLLSHSLIYLPLLVCLFPVVQYVDAFVSITLNCQGSKLGTGQAFSSSSLKHSHGPPQLRCPPSFELFQLSLLSSSAQEPADPRADSDIRLASGPYLTFRGKVLNIYGFVYALQAWLWAILLFPFCLAGALLGVLFDRQRMRLPSVLGMAWGRLSLWTMGIHPRVVGTEWLPDRGEQAVFVSNHTSYLDIPVMACLPRLFKYLMKAELRWLPLVGWKAVLARDIFVKRQSRASFPHLLKRVQQSVSAGNSIAAFPEGTRSANSNLGSFKRGPFLMASQAGVRVVPISISGVSEAMPPTAMAPLWKVWGAFSSFVMACVIFSFFAASKETSYGVLSYTLWYYLMLLTIAAVWGWGRRVKEAQS